MPRKKQHKRGYLCYRSRQRGIALLASAVSAIMLFGMAGLAIDIGRMYITKNEAHGYADGAAIAAARKLDGTAAGLNNAENAVSASTNKVNATWIACRSQPNVLSSGPTKNVQPY